MEKRIEMNFDSLSNIPVEKTTWSTITMFAEALEKDLNYSDNKRIFKFSILQSVGRRAILRDFDMWKPDGYDYFMIKETCTRLLGVGEKAKYPIIWCDDMRATPYKNMVSHVNQAISGMTKQSLFDNGIDKTINMAMRNAGYVVPDITEH